METLEIVAVGTLVFSLLVSAGVAYTVYAIRNKESTREQLINKLTRVANVQDKILDKYRPKIFMK